jgi:hypothetical protein
MRFCVLHAVGALRNFTGNLPGMEMNAMTEEKGAEHVDVEKIKAALVSAGMLKSVTLSVAEKENIRKEFARLSTDRVAPDFLIICSTAHYCLVVKDLPKMK